MAADGTWRDSPCEGSELGPYACWSNRLNEWALTDEWPLAWEECFDACGSYVSDWRFAAPIRETGNRDLHHLVQREFGRPLNVWLNSTDARQEGVWRQADRTATEEVVVMPLTYRRTHLLLKPWVAWGD
jgi:hypothetical protein